jgi:hypothetical protein
VQHNRESHGLICKSVSYANVDEDRSLFDRDGRDESPEHPLRFQLGYRFGGWLSETKEAAS